MAQSSLDAYTGRLVGQYRDLELWMRLGTSASAISTSAGASDRVLFLPLLWLRALASAAVGSMPTLESEACTLPTIRFRMRVCKRQRNQCGMTPSTLLCQLPASTVTNVSKLYLQVMRL